MTRDRVLTQASSLRPFGAATAMPLRSYSPFALLRSNGPGDPLPPSLTFRSGQDIDGKHSEQYGPSGDPAPAGAPPGCRLLKGDAVTAGIGVLIPRRCRHRQFAQFGVRSEKPKVMHLMHSWRRDQRRQSSDRPRFRAQRGCAGRSASLPPER